MVVCSFEDYVPAIVGGILIGLSASLNLYFTGRITGLSGIFGTLIKYDLSGGFYWKFAFFVGLLSGALPLYYGSTDGAYINSKFTLRFFD